MHFNLQKLFDELGGVSAVSKMIGVGRTVPYGWLRRDTLSSKHLSLIKQAQPLLDFNRYFETEDKHDKENTRHGT